MAKEFEVCISYTDGYSHQLEFSGKSMGILMGCSMNDSQPFSMVTRNEKV